MDLTDNEDSGKSMPPSWCSSMSITTRNSNSHSRCRSISINNSCSTKATRSRRIMITLQKNLSSSTTSSIVRRKKAKKKTNSRPLAATTIYNSSKTSTTRVVRVLSFLLRNIHSTGQRCAEMAPCAPVPTAASPTPRRNWGRSPSKISKN